MQCTRAELVARFTELSRDTLSSACVPEMARFIQHGETTTLDHVRSVALLSLAIVSWARIPCDEASLVRGALLHDYYLYDWHDGQAAPDRWHGFTHPGHALANAERDFRLTDVERDIIVHHMFPLVPSPPRTREALVVCLADKVATVVEVLARRPWGAAELGVCS